MRNLLTLTFGLIISPIFSQTWSDDVASVVYNNCAVCHRPGGLAPFSLMTYEETSPLAASLYNEIMNNEMPPWSPNDDYQQYAHSRKLSATDKQIFLDWLINGTPEGNPANTPPPPSFPTGSLLGDGDLQVRIPDYASNAVAGNDDYVCFSLPTGLTQNRKIRAIEVIPGRPEIVHHVGVFIDPTATYPTDTVGGDCGGQPNNNLAGFYIPGSTPLVFPSGGGLKLGMNIAAGSNIILQIHYPAGSYGIVDSTRVIFHFYPENETGVREVYTAPILQNWNFQLLPNQETTVIARYPDTGGLTSDLSLLSVFPHMHLLGKSAKSYAINSGSDTIKFIDIPHYDFHWQDFYLFKNMQHLTTGSVMHSEMVFDNTVNNEHNPNNPPLSVFPGENTTDEMALVYFHYLEYQAGDENYDLEEIMAAGITEMMNPETTDWKVYPVPFTSSVHIQPLSIVEGDLVSIYIYDQMGSLIKKLIKNQTIEANFGGFDWDGTTETGAATSKGLYYISMNRNGEFSSAPVIRN